MLFTPKYIIGTYFDTKLSMFGLAPSATEEGAEGPQNGLKGCGDLGALFGAFGPLFSSNKYQSKHVQFSVKIGPNNIFGGK